MLRGGLSSLLWFFASLAPPVSADTSLSSLAAAFYDGRNSTAVMLRRTGTSRLRSSRRCLPRPRIDRQPLSQVTKVFDYGILSMTACKNIVWTTSSDVVLRGWAFGLPEKKLEHPWNCEVQGYSLNDLFREKVVHGVRRFHIWNDVLLKAHGS